MQNMTISSNAFQYGQRIPRAYTCDGKDISPQISWNIVRNARSYVLIMEDPDAPGGTFVHWIIYNIPPYVHILPEGVPKSSTLEPWPFGDGALQGITDFGTIGYGGPCPPPGKPHRYFFKIYALDIKLGLPPGISKKDIEKAMTNYIIATGELIGIYIR